MNNEPVASDLSYLVALKQRGEATPKPEAVKVIALAETVPSVTVETTIKVRRSA